MSEKKKEKKIFLVCFCVFLFQVFDDQTMKYMTNMKFGEVCHVISRPGGSRREGKQWNTRMRSAWRKRFESTWARTKALGEKAKKKAVR